MVTNTPQRQCRDGERIVHHLGKAGAAFKEQEAMGHPF
jgi:hypothetical protein